MGAGNPLELGNVGEGVFGPFDSVPVVYEEAGVCEPLFKIEDPREPSRGDDVPEEYAWFGCGSGNEGNLSARYIGLCTAW